MPITFDVDPSKVPSSYPLASSSIEDHLASELARNKGKLLKATNSSKDYIDTGFNNGFVGACITAYNNHYHLQISPDEVWIAITSSLSRYITANAEKLRDKFVSHAGKKELIAFGGGNILSADYDNLIGQLSTQIDENTKSDVKDWLECSFSTTTPISKIVSKIVLMAAMKEYFSYKMCLECGLPKVTLLGTEEDWKSIRRRVDKLRSYDDKTLSAWSDVLALVLDQFVAAFSDKPIDTDFWNRVAHISGGGSGPSYLKGWVLAFVAFDDTAMYILRDAEEIKKTKSFGKMETQDVPTATVQVPVKIDDNGKEYETLFYAGPMLAVKNGNTISTALDWALVEIPKKE